MQIARAVGISRLTLYHEIDRGTAEQINTKSGHWKIYTIIGKKKSSPVLLALEERLTSKRHLIKIPSQGCEAVRLCLEKIDGLYGENFETVFNPVTSDNGSEFVDLCGY